MSVGVTTDQKQTKYLISIIESFLKCWIIQEIYRDYH